ncbi:MAG TPA: class II glutamine amidotransferase [Burkholderiales bacterium]|nr:class II glutamine amidotransferase [Burkholderiales bacterium]
MCQLLGMNCNVPTDICFSFAGFHRRGGATDEHADGWGIAFFEGPGCRLFLDSKSAVESPIAELVRKYPIHSMNVIAHIRRATQGRVALENTHPFVRELWGRYWIFAHNGTLENFTPTLRGDYRPVGTTDSERAFCYVLETLRRRFPDAQPPLEDVFGVLEPLTRELAAHGRFNYLLSNGEYLAAHCYDRLCYILRHAPFAQAHLIDDDVTVDFSAVTTPNDKVAVIATTPLTDNETWTPMAPRQLIVFRDGSPVLTA